MMKVGSKMTDGKRTPSSLLFILKAIQQSKIRCRGILYTLVNDHLDAPRTSAKALTIYVLLLFSPNKALETFCDFAPR